MLYDVIVVGGGPAGLMAARTAAAGGLKVALVERKADLTRVKRACMQIFYINKMTPNMLSGKTEPKRDGHIDPVSVEVQPGKAVFHFPVPDFALEFSGQLRPYLNWVQVSPKRHLVHHYQPDQKVWGFYLQKEALLDTLQKQAETAGASIIASTLALGAEAAGDGVSVRCSRQGKEQLLKGRKLIVADGLESRMVESLGLNRDRTPRPQRHVLMYVLEGVKGDWSHNSVVTFTIPSICATGNIFMALLADGRNLLGAGYGHGNTPAAQMLDRLMAHPGFQDYFGKARKVDSLAATLVPRTPFAGPAQGNLVIVGDAGAWVETWMQGALASGYQGAKAIIRELDGRPGNDEYNRWWQKAFAFNTPEYQYLLRYRIALQNICDDDEIDYLFSLMESDYGIPSALVRGKLERVKIERPGLYQRLIDKAVPQGK